MTVNLKISNLCKDLLKYSIKTAICFLKFSEQTFQNVSASLCISKSEKAKYIT